MAEYIVATTYQNPFGGCDHSEIIRVSSDLDYYGVRRYIEDRYGGVVHVIIRSDEIRGLKIEENDDGGGHSTVAHFIFRSDEIRDLKIEKDEEGESAASVLSKVQDLNLEED